MGSRRDTRLDEVHDGPSVLILDSRPEHSVGRSIRRILAQATPPLVVRLIEGPDCASRAADSLIHTPPDSAARSPSLVLIVRHKEGEPLTQGTLGALPVGGSHCPRLIVCPADHADPGWDVTGELFTDFLLWPCRAIELLARVQWHLRKPTDSHGRGSQCQTPEPAIDSHKLIGRCDSIMAILRDIERIAPSKASVLISGETGTGKEVCARVIHSKSDRCGAPFVAINCAAIPNDLFENQLFGHEQGAYTGATRPKQGLIAAVGRGTLFLDEVDALALALQAKLLRFLQDGEIRRLGAERQVQTDVRIVAATNADVQGLIALKAFRADLLYRLAVVSIQMPPLRTRGEDILWLAAHFVHQHAVQYRREPLELSSEAGRLLCDYRWPGNVRELSHVLEQAVLRASKDVIEPEDLRIPKEGPSTGPETFNACKERVIADFEESYLKEMMERHGGNISEAARKAGKNRRAFYELLRKHGMLPGRQIG